MPAKEQEYFKGIATKELYPEKSVKENTKDKEVDNESFGNRFTQSLGLSKFLQEEKKQPDKSLRQEFRIVKDTGEKEKE